jgi:hypothetical protein
MRLRLCVESAISMESKLLEKEENSAIKGAVKSALFPSECHFQVWDACLAHAKKSKPPPCADAKAASSMEETALSAPFDCDASVGEFVAIQPVASISQNADVDQQTALKQASQGASQTPLVILIYDEARALMEIVPGLGTSKFCLLCKALRRFSTDSETKHFNLMAIFIDTTSCIQNFSPALENDPSAWEGDDDDETDYTQLELFHPFILYGTSDLHFQGLSDGNLMSLLESREFMQAGRPLVKKTTLCRIKLFTQKINGRIHLE